MLSNNHTLEPKQAMEQFTGEPFIDWLARYTALQVETWPETVVIRNATPKPEKIRKFLVQRFLASEAFFQGQDGDPGFLGFATGNLSEANDPLSETALEMLEQRKGESVRGNKNASILSATQQHELWLRLLKALGASDEELKRAEPKENTRNYIAELSDLYSNSPWQMALGGFASHEQAVSHEFKIILEMLKKNTALSDHDLEILTRHAETAVDENRQGHILEKVVFDLDNKKLVWQGAERQLQIRREFLAGLLKYLTVV